MRRAATVQGYVADVKVGGVESVDCHTKDPIDRDTHIELTLTPNDPDEATHVIMEVTPRWRALMNQRGSDWSTSALRRALLGRWIEVNGDGLGLWHLFELHSVLRYIFHHDWPARRRGVRHHHLVPQLTLTTMIEGWYNPRRPLGARPTVTHQLRTRDVQAVHGGLNPKSPPVRESGSTPGRAVDHYLH